MPRKEQRGSLGRRLAIGIYSVALAYLVIVGFASVIPQVFWPESDDSFDLECADGLQLLRHEVDEVRIAYLATNETDPAQLRSTLKSWDFRLNALAKRCDEGHVHLLNEYRHRVELGLERYMREDAPLANSVSEALGSNTEPQSLETPEPTP
ncbi:MAG: hypothetical protein JRE45_10865 [Deltaproteobacteria bacterium]|nr:hypothetical protein [Deltaproteobacteria bacterium]MBW1875159.1 hypothetical protein [Deltaproteobacteria bacterium]MBW2214336.1 hypothetical protein [Deltaproteobacteria bacterium]MBW2378467.1 hypothetical protein [Deltaproteobacteria bacterium]MBW2550579.1 hypothetical protein [Deltaproteobacteria bacterium]